MRKEFLAVFQITKMKTFEVNYYTLNLNRKPHFATSAYKFIRSKCDYSRGGQAQASILPEGSVARRFWKKWDDCHLKDLTDEQYSELLNDLEELKTRYNYIFKDLSEYDKPYSPTFDFGSIVELSKQNLKKNNLK